MQFLGVAGKQYLFIHNGREVVLYEVSRFPVLDSVFTVAEGQLGAADLAQLFVSDKYFLIADSSRGRREVLFYNFDLQSGTYTNGLVVDINHYATLGDFALRNEYRFRMLDIDRFVVEVAFRNGVPIVKYAIFSSDPNPIVIWNTLSGEWFSTIHTALSGDNLYIATKEKIAEGRYAHRIFRHHIPTDTLYDVTLTTPLDENLVVRNVIADSQGHYLYIDAGSIARINLQTGAVLPINVSGGMPEQFIVDEAAHALYLRYPAHVSVVTLSEDGYSETRTIRIDEQGQVAIEQITFGVENRYLYFFDSKHRLWQLHMPTSDPNPSEDSDIYLEELSEAGAADGVGLCTSLQLNISLCRTTKSKQVGLF